MLVFTFLGLDTPLYLSPISDTAVLFGDVQVQLRLITSESYKPGLLENQISILADELPSIKNSKMKCKKIIQRVEYAALIARVSKITEKSAAHLTKQLTLTVTSESQLS